MKTKYCKDGTYYIFSKHFDLIFDLKGVGTGWMLFPSISFRKGGAGIGWFIQFQWLNLIININK